MRYQPDHKAATHQRIVRNASRQLRAKGMNGPAVATLMKSAGLTHGGFYRHFLNREGLVAEAIDASLLELRDRLLAAAGEVGPKDAWRAMVKTYLSLELCDRPDDGCPIAALAPEMARALPPLKRRISQSILNFRQAVLPFMPGSNAQEKAANFLAVFSSMVGAIEIARTMPEKAVRQRILDSVRDHLLRSF